MRTLVKFETPSGKTAYVPYDDGKKKKKAKPIPQKPQEAKAG